MQWGLKHKYGRFNVQWRLKRTDPQIYVQWGFKRNSEPEGPKLDRKPLQAASRFRGPIVEAQILGYFGEALLFRAVPADARSTCWVPAGAL